MLICAGITHYGTLAAGELASNPAYLNEALRDVPGGWTHKNLQIVLETHISNASPGPPRVLATHFW